MPSSPDTPPCFAVAGSPILGSLSAPLYRGLFERLGVRAHYTRLAVSEAQAALQLAGELRLAGFNATSPIKRDLLPLLRQLSPAAQAAGAVNTAKLSSGTWFGDNTDVAGVVQALALHGVSPTSTRVSVLGAGGAARAVLVALGQAGFTDVRLCNRGRGRARAIERDLGTPGLDLDQLEGVLATSDLLISCVPGDPHLIPAAWLRPGMWVLDADYRARGLRRAARLAGCNIIPGSDWLALQAAVSCEAFLTRRLDPSTRSWMCRQTALPRPAMQGPIVLMGFSGAGKSSVGAILARLLGRPFVDTDQEVVRQAGADIPSLFAREGEADFRARERRAVARALATPDAVVALGGGALLHPETLTELQDCGLCVLLHAPLDLCVERAADGGRPLLDGRTDPRSLWEQRRAGYLACAELVLPSGQGKPEQLARQLLAELERAGSLRPPSATLDIRPGSSVGQTLRAPPSKSHGIRSLCAATLAQGHSVLQRPPGCADFGAAMGICEALGAKLKHRSDSLEIAGIGGSASRGSGGPVRFLNCGESALCLRLFACVAAALGGAFRLEARGSLRDRNVAPLVHALRDLGARCSSQGGRPPLVVEGPFTRTRVLLDASSSSQVLTGLLMASPLSEHPTTIEARGLVSHPYVSLTLEALSLAGVQVESSEALDRFVVHGPQPFEPVHAAVECDWSALAFLLVAAAITGHGSFEDVQANSSQGDRAVLEVLRSAGAKLSLTGTSLTVTRGALRPFHFDATHHPDLFPPLAVLAAACPGRSEIVGVGRLRNKESDRAFALERELGTLGIRVELRDDLMVIHGGSVRAGAVDAHGDHRIAMALAVAALRATEPCQLTGAEHVAKSYPRFFHDLRALCGAEA